MQFVLPKKYWSQYATLNPIKVTRPLELIHIGYLMIEAPKNSWNQKDVNIFSSGSFHKVCTSIHDPKSEATTVAKTLWDKFFTHYGFPEKILSDQG